MSGPIPLSSGPFNEVRNYGGLTLKITQNHPFSWAIFVHRIASSAAARRDWGLEDPLESFTLVTTHKCCVVEIELLSLQHLRNGQALRLVLCLLLNE